MTDISFKHKCQQILSFSENFHYLLKISCALITVDCQILLLCRLASFSLLLLFLNWLLYLDTCSGFLDRRLWYQCHKMMDMLKNMVKLCAQMMNMIGSNLLQLGKDPRRNENLHT